MDKNRPAPESGDHLIIEGRVLTPSQTAITATPIVLMNDGDELAPLLGAPVPSPSELLPALSRNAPPATGVDPEFDAYMAVVRLIIGGSIEGAAELLKRLERWETEFESSGDAPGPGEIHSGGDVTRYLLVGMVLSASDGARRRAIKLAEASDVFWRITGSATQPLVNNRLTGLVARPLDRAVDRLVSRGQQQVSKWVELGRTHEPGARRIARKTYVEIVDEFIGHLAENEELAGLVQEQSVGLASEAVDEIRSRTVSADALAEGFVRRILRRPPRRELPSPPEEILQAITDSAKSTHHP